MEYLLIIILTIAGVEYGFVLDNPLWTQQACDEMADEINQSFVAVGTAVMQAHCEPKVR